jgi:mannan endo-1,6-alpha-mannosidase
MDPFTYDAVRVKLRASAAAAAKTCTGGDKGTSCGLKWTDQKWDGSKGVGEQMSVMEVLQSNLISNVAPPVTNSSGGTSKGDGSAGTRSPSSKLPSVLTDPITTADRAGAGILTGLMFIAIVGSTGWMILD